MKKQLKPVNTPTILQMEAVECGAASLAMILAYYGKYVPLETLRLQCGISRDGSKAINLLKAARKHGFECKGYRKEPQLLKEMSFPMIIHWNFNHFIVLEGFYKDKVYLNDPASGKRVVSEAEFDQAFTGIALTFEKTDAFEKGGEKPDTLKALIRRVKGSEVALTYVILVGFALVIPGLIIPAFSKIFIDEILLAGRLDWVNVLLMAMGITVLIQGFLVWLQEYYLLRLETKIALTSSSKFLWHVLRLPMEFFSQRYVGDISSRMNSNDNVARILSGEFTKAVLNVFFIIFYFFLMLRYDVFLTMIGVLAAVLNMLYLKTVAKKREAQNSKLLKDHGKMIGTAMSGLQTIETLKATGSESDFFAKWSGYQTKAINAQQEIGVSGQYLLSLPSLMTGITTVLVLMIGGIRIIEGAMTVGTLVAFQSLMGGFLNPVTALVNLGSDIQTMAGDMNRLDDVMRYPEDKILETERIEIKDSDHWQERLDGVIEVKDLTFGYSLLEPPLIENFNMRLNAGKRVALVGGSGSGKSTLAKLISGTWQQWSGEIYFDGKLRTTIPRIVITNSLSAVDQDICMFSGTVRDNITLWDDSISEIDIVKAAKDACIHDDIISRPGGYDSIVQEAGINFSGGQRQRIEIARALAKNPSIIIMDEATSALDPNTEKIVSENIRRRGCTCIIVAHRLSTIRDCEEIIVLDNGKILERGNHEALRAAGGLYASLIKAG